MHAAQFETAVEKIVHEKKCYDPLAYYFLKESLDYTLTRFKESQSKGNVQRHVSGKELAFGFRDLALQEFGPMAATLLSEWNIHNTRDIGEMVFHLIDHQMFGKQESDTLEDFDDLYAFHDAFVEPFSPKGQKHIHPTDASHTPTQKTSTANDSST